MNEYDTTEFSLQSGEWVIKEAIKLVNQIKFCKTIKEKNKLKPRLEYMMKKLSFERKELSKLIDQ